MPDNSRIIWYDELGSTNDEARKLIDSLEDLSLVAAASQTSGRGQGDHSWTSTPGENLTFSAVLKFGQRKELKASESLLVTCFITEVVADYLSGHGIKAAVKWPNDIYVDGRKICGILIENVIQGTRLRSSIVGVGLNLNQTDFPAELPNPVSVSMLTGLGYDVRTELSALHEAMKKSAGLLETGEGRTYLRKMFDGRVFRVPGEQR